MELVELFEHVSGKASTDLLPVHEALALKGGAANVHHLSVMYLCSEILIPTSRAEIVLARSKHNFPNWHGVSADLTVQIGLRLH
jgi:hypothetical protein